MVSGYSDPIAIHDDLWTRLALGARDAKHPWHWPAVAITGSDGAPTIRTIVLREVDRATRTLWFFTDARSPKVAMLRADRRIAFCFNDGPANMQLRVAAMAGVLIDGPEVESCWGTIPPPTRAAYAQNSIPGTKLDSRIPKPAATGDAGRENFAVVQCLVNEIDWLQLDPAGHYRMRFTFAADGSMTSSWLAP